MKPSLSLPLAAALVLVSGAALAEEATDARVRNVEVRKIVLAHGDDAGAAKTGVFVSRIQTDGDDPVTSLQVLGSDAAEIDIDDIADGETRSFELRDGKWMDVTREGDKLRLRLDDRDIEIPLNPGADMMLPGLAGLGAKHVEIMMLDGDDLALHGEGAHGAVFVTEDGALQHLENGDLHWTEAGDAAFGTKGRVIVKRIGHDGADGQDVQVMALPGFAWQGAAAMPNFDELDSLKDADPAVRAKVVEALREILGKQHAVELHVEVDGDASAADGATMSPRRTTRPGKVEVR